MLTTTANLKIERNQPLQVVRNNVARLLEANGATQVSEVEGVIEFVGNSKLLSPYGHTPMDAVVQGRVELFDGPSGTDLDVRIWVRSYQTLLRVGYFAAALTIGGLFWESDFPSISRTLVLILLIIPLFVPIGAVSQWSNLSYQRRWLGDLVRQAAAENGGGE